MSVAAPLSLLWPCSGAGVQVPSCRAHDPLSPAPAELSGSGDSSPHGRRCCRRRPSACFLLPLCLAAFHSALRPFHPRLSLFLPSVIYNFFLTLCKQCPERKKTQSHVFLPSRTSSSCSQRDHVYEGPFNTQGESRWPEN